MLIVAAPPRLAYFGFLDPELMYGLPVAEPSLLGHMGYTRQRIRGSENAAAWKVAMEVKPGVIVGSVSALQLDPYGIDFSGVRESDRLGRIGLCFFAYHVVEPEHVQ